MAIDVPVLTGACLVLRGPRAEVEGREREAARVDGRWQDDIVIGILEEEFVGTRPN
jgi:hypothetical protein